MARPRTCGQAAPRSRWTGRHSARGRRGGTRVAQAGSRRAPGVPRPAASGHRNVARDLRRGSAASSRARRLRVAWCSASATSRPKALNTPGSGGTITRAMPSSAAIAGGEQRPVAAERQQRELPRVAPALHRHRADRTHHRCRCQTQHADMPLPPRNGATVRQACARSARARPRRPASVRRRPAPPGSR